MLDVFPADLRSIITFEQSPLAIEAGFEKVTLPGVYYPALLCAIQCLSLTEQRRYKRNDKLGGGKYLAARFCAGIAACAWSAEDAMLEQKRGLAGLYALRTKFGNEPWLGKT